ncbi:MAG: hypothetical protein H7281_13525 [Bacteriovorax sp.]|nr:hypothetical protein [Bacteriovorax sp.]
MKWTKQSLYSFLILSILLIVSCSKQKSPEIASEEVKGSREIQRLEACSKVNFNKGVLLYQNMLQLFVCTKWDEQFPNMFQSMNKITAASWDHMMAPIDQSFIENQQRRDRVFKNIRELDSKGGLDNLSYVIVALNETNFFDSTKALFTCVDNQLDPICLTRMGRIPEKKSLKNIIKLIDTSPESIDNLSQFLKLTVKALDGHQEDLRTEINKFRVSPLYVPARLQLVDSIAAKVRAGFSDEDREFVSKILLTGNQNGDVPWIYQWIQDLKMNREKFRDLLEYPVLANPEFVGEIKNLEKAYNGGLVCSIKSTASPNDLIEFDFKIHLSEYVGVLKNKDYKNFYDYSATDILGLKLSTEVCKELESNHYNVNFIKLLTHFAEFLGEKKYYDLVKFLISQSTAKGDPDKTFAENLYLFDLITGDIFSAGNALNSNIISSTRNFYPVVFDVVKSLPPEGYISLGQLVQSIGRPENDTRFKGVADFWTFFTPEEKNFVFNFVDRHFDKGTNFVLLFDFYTKFLDDLKEVQPIFKNKWMGTPESEDMSYLTLQELFSKFAGKETLLDFKKFFSRDQILKVLEVISNGQSINKLAAEELQYIKSDNYIIRSRSERYKFKVSYDAGLDVDYDAKEVIDCMQKFTDIQNGFYQLLRSLPTACSKVTGANIAFRLYGWLNAIEDNYLKFKQASNGNDSLLDKNGILSPYMINTSLGMAKIMDNLLGPLGSSVPSKNGINYLLSSANYHLNQKSAAPLIDKNLQWMNSLIDVMPEKNTLHRNALVKSFTREDNFTYSKNVFNNLGKLFIDYGDWVKSGELLKAQNRNLGDYDPRQDCNKVINQVVTPYPCPTKETVKLYGNDMLFVFQNTWEAEKGSPIAMLMKATKKGEGLDIPLDGKKTKKFRMSLRDTFHYMYDASDKSFDVNKVNVKFVNDTGNSSVENLTTLERIESVIREVRFENNYLGVAFLNAVVHGNDYNADVAVRKKLLQKCVKIPGIRCARKMSDSDLRMALNSLEVYDSLLDVNNGRGFDSRLQFGEYLKTFETSLVASSAMAAQKVQLFPLKNEILLKHNGKILTDMTVMTTWSNVARVIRDRVGRTRKEFDNFIESEEFKRVDRALLYGFDLPVSSVSAEHLIKKLSIIPANEKQNLFGNTVDWIASLSYNETRLVEDTLARVMVVGSYLGTPEIVFSKEGYGLLDQKYADNNLFQVFLALEKIVDYWPTLKNYFPGDVRLIDVVKPVNTALYFLTTKLNSEIDPKKNTAYLALNDLFLILQTSLFDNLPNPQIGANPANTTQGLDLLLEMFKDSKLVTNTYTVARDDYHYLDIFHQNNAEWFSSMGQNFRRIAQSPQVDFTPVRDFLAFTSKNVICQSGDRTCRDNYHYDEPANLVRFLNKKSDSGQSNFMLMNQRMFVENFDQISQMIDDLLPCIKIKEVRPPLRLN